MRTILTVLTMLTAFAFGCCKTKYVTKTEVVRKPVPIYNSVPNVSYPALDESTENITLEDIDKMLNTIRMLKNENKELRLLLSRYEKNAKENNKIIKKNKKNVK